MLPTAGSPIQPTTTPIYKKWWFWTIVGGVAAAATVSGVVLGAKYGGPGYTYTPPTN